MLRLAANAISFSMVAIPCMASAELLSPGPDLVLPIPPVIQVSYRTPQIEWLADGSLMALYEHQLEAPGQERGAYLQRLAQDGTAIGSPIRVSSVDGVPAEGPRFAMAPDGSFVVVFQTYTPPEESGVPSPLKDGDSWGVFARPFDASGAPLSAGFQLSDSSVDYQGQPDVAYLGSGRWVAVWVITEGHPSDQHLRVRQLDALGASMGAEFELAPEGDALHDVAVVSNGSGIYGVAWADRNAATTVQTFDDTDQTIAIKALGTPPNNSGSIVRTAMTPDGTVYAQHADGATGFQPKVEVFSPDGSPITSSIPVGREPIAVAPDGRWIGSQPQFGNFTAASYEQHDSDGTTIGRAFAGRSDLQPMVTWDEALAANASGSVALLYTATRNRNFFFDRGALENDDPVRHYLRLFCDSSDPNCDRCAGDDDIDTDADGRPDDCDPCVRPADAAGILAGYVAIQNRESAHSNPRTNRVRVSALVSLPSSSGGFDTLPVMARGLRIRVESRDEGSLVEAQLPGGAYAGKGTRGWMAKAGGLRYRDTTTTPVRGFRGVRLKSTSTGAVSVNAKASQDQYGVNANYLPVRVAITFGDPSDDSAGLCAETLFELAECESEITGDQTGTMYCRVEP